MLWPNMIRAPYITRFASVASYLGITTPLGSYDDADANVEAFVQAATWT